MLLKGMIFDFDGLILDTELPRYRAWDEIYQSFGRRLSMNEYADCLGSSNSAFDPLSSLQKILPGITDLQGIQQRQQARELALLSQEQALPGVRELISEAKDKGIRMAIASSSDRPWVVTHLDRLGLIGYFQAIFTENEVSLVKPHPELFEKAAKALDLPIAEIVAFEDSPNGMIAARKAGLFVIGVPNPVTRQLDTSMANLILPTLDQMTIQKLVELINTKDVENG